MDKTLTMLVGLFLASVFFSPANATDFGATFQEAQIEDAIISPANKNGIRTLRFRLTNLTVGNLTILGVKNTNHTNSRIMAELKPLEFVKLDSLSIPAEETLDMAHAGIFVQIEGIQSPFKSSHMINLKLIFAHGELPFRAHITP